jgi:RHS repeat-associated protein
MAMKVRYNTVDGEIVGEQRSGVKSFYVPDGLGSTIALADNSGIVTDRIGYWPYGSVASRTGSSETPFLFGGGSGYYTTLNDLNYVRARYFWNTSAQWLTVDPFRFTSGQPDYPHPLAVSMYLYAFGNPQRFIDPSGLWPEVITNPTGDPALGSSFYGADTFGLGPLPLESSSLLSVLGASAGPGRPKPPKKSACDAPRNLGRDMIECASICGKYKLACSDAILTEEFACLDKAGANKKKSDACFAEFKSRNANLDRLHSACHKKCRELALPQVPMDQAMNIYTVTLATYLS